MLLSNGKSQELDCQLERGDGYAALGCGYPPPVRALVGRAQHGMVLSRLLLRVVWRRGRYHCVRRYEEQS